MQFYNRAQRLPEASSSGELRRLRGAALGERSREAQTVASSHTARLRQWVTLGTELVVWQVTGGWNLCDPQVTRVGDGGLCVGCARLLLQCLFFRRARRVFLVSQACQNLQSCEISVILPTLTTERTRMRQKWNSNPGPRAHALAVCRATLSCHPYLPKARPCPTYKHECNLGSCLAHGVVRHVSAGKSRGGWVGAALRSYFLGHSSV